MRSSWIAALCTLAILLLAFTSSRVTVAQGSEQSGTGPFSVTSFSGGANFSISVPTDITRFQIPRNNSYIVVGGNDYDPVNVSISNLTGWALGSTRAWSGEIFLPGLKPGSYTLETAGIGRFVLALDIQDSGDTFSGDISAPVALFMTPFSTGINLNVRTGLASDGYSIQLFNDSLALMYSVQQKGSFSSNIMFSSHGNDFVVARLLPDQPMNVSFQWFPLNTQTNGASQLIGTFGVPIVLVAMMVGAIFALSRRKK